MKVICKQILLTFLITGLLFNQISKGGSEEGIPQYDVEFDHVYTNKIFNNQLRSAKFRVNSLELVAPIITLFGSENLEFSFDDLDGDVKNYYYTIELCNHDWTPSDLSAMEYIDGYESNPVFNYNYSSITVSKYTHYKILLPNEDLSITKSGNYILKIYLDNDQDNMMITHRFYVMEKKVEISANVKRATSLLYRETHQEIDFTLDHEGMEISNPFESLNVTLIQNGRPDNAKIGLKPTFIRDEELVYDYEEENIFPSTKEFRWADLQSLIYLEHRVKFMETILGKSHVYMVEDQIKSFDKYFYSKDINGNFFISTKDENDRDLNSEYVQLHFTLPFNKPLFIGDLYIMGAFTNWDATELNRMVYNEKRKAYELELEVKQGYYNYMIGYKEQADEEIDFNLIEGYFFDSENDYTILVYYRPFGERHDAIIGVKNINSYVQ